MSEHEHPGATRLTLVFGGIVLALPLIVHFLAAYLTQVLTTFAPEDAQVLLASTALQGLVMYGLLTTLLLFYLRATLEPLSHYGWTGKRDHLALAIGIGLLAGVVMYGIDIASGYPFDLPPLSVMAFLTVLLGSALLPAVFEETLFRGVIQGAYARVLTGKLGPVPVAVLVASGFEVLFHLLFPLYFGGLGAWTFAQLGYVAVFGGIGGYLYARTGSLLAPIIIHALGNLTEYLIVWMTH
jgi:membrane protease YdiL (CAAX protease family)